MLLSIVANANRVRYGRRMHDMPWWYIGVILLGFAAIVGVDYCRATEPASSPCDRACRPAVKCGWDHGVVCYPTRTCACVSGGQRTTDP